MESQLHLILKQKHNSLDQLGKYPCNVYDFLKDNPGFTFVPDRNLNLQCALKIPSNSDCCNAVVVWDFLMYVYSGH